MVHHEGRRYVPYLDPAGVLTVCAGVTGPDVIRGKRYTPAECEALESKHLRVAKGAVQRQINTYAQLNRWQQAALIDFAYNLGEGKLAGATMRKRFNAGDVVGGCNELVRWVKARVGGELVTLRGLVTRRDNELDLCLHWTD